MTIPTPPWWLASILANVCICAIEYLNRAGGFADFRHAVTTTGPLIILAQWGLFYAWRDAPSMLLAWAFFTTGNAVLRLISSHFAVGEELNWMVAAGVSLMFAGVCVLKWSAG